MKIRCGVPVYANGEHVGNVRGVRVDAVNDRVSGVVLGPSRAAHECYELELDQIASADAESIRSDAPAEQAVKLLSTTCGEEDVRMSHWLNSLVPDTGWESSDLSARFVTFSEPDRGEFTLPGSHEVGIDSCGAGFFESIDVDARGYIESVTVRVDEKTGATVPMKPVMKRSRESLVDSAHSSLRLA